MGQGRKKNHVSWKRINKDEVPEDVRGRGIAGCECARSGGVVGATGNSIVAEKGGTDRSVKGSNIAD